MSKNDAKQTFYFRSPLDYFSTSAVTSVRRLKNILWFKIKVLMMAIIYFNILTPDLNLSSLNEACTSPGELFMDINCAQKL